MAFGVVFLGGGVGFCLFFFFSQSFVPTRSHPNGDLQTRKAEPALQRFLRPVLVGFAAGIPARMGTGWELGCARLTAGSLSCASALSWPCLAQGASGCPQCHWLGLLLAGV